MLARNLALVALFALPLAAGCTRKTSDRDLVYLNPYEAIEKSNATPGLFEHERRTAWLDPRTPEQYADYLKSEIAKFARVVKEAKITAQ